VNDPKKKRSDTPKFRLKGVEFTPAEIESIIQVDPL
jgi:hypothetical protein